MVSFDIASHFLIEFFQDSALIMRVDDKKTLELDEIGQEIFRLFISGDSLDKIATLLSERYRISVDSACTDVKRVLDHLASIGLTSKLVSESELRILDSDELGIPISLSL